MKILQAHIFGYGTLVNRKFVFSDNFNALIGDNESGKSTLMSFIKSTLYGHNRRQRQTDEVDIPEYRKYKPRQSSEYGGYLIIETQERVIRIERDFENNILTVYDHNNQDITSEFSLRAGRSSPGRDLLGMDADFFTSTVFIAQNQGALYAQDKEHINQALMNISHYMQEDVSAASAISRLKLAARQLGNPKTIDRPYNIVKEKLEIETSKQVKLEQDIAQQQHNMQLKDSLAQQIAQLQESEKSVLKADIYDKTMQDISLYNKYSEQYKRYSIKNEDHTQGNKKTLLVFLSILSCIMITLMGIYLSPFLFLLLLIPISALIWIFAQSLSEPNISNQDYEHLTQQYQDLMSDILERQDVLDYEALVEKADFYKPNTTYTSYTLTDYTADEIASMIQEKKEEAAVAENLSLMHSQAESELLQVKSNVDALHISLKEIEEKKQAIEYAIESIEEAAKQLKDSSVLPALTARAGEYLINITAGAYDNISMGTSNTLSIQHENYIYPLGSFSEGTLRQIYLAYRLAASDIIGKDINAPIFLDEALVFFDKKRRLSTLEFLQDLSKNRQIFYFATDISQEFVNNYDITIIPMQL